MRDIPGFPGYKITKKGTVYSSYYRGTNTRGKYHQLKGTLISKGRMRVTIGSTPMLIHRLVALTYIPNPGNLPVVMHLDNNPLNNYYKNLKWGTDSDNMQQCWDENRNRGCTKLSLSQVEEITIRYKSGGISMRKLGKEYGVSAARVCTLINNTSPRKNAK